MSRVDCHTLPAGESGSSMVAPAKSGRVASSVAGAMITRVYYQKGNFRDTVNVKWLKGEYSDDEGSKLT